MRYEKCSDTSYQMFMHIEIQAQPKTNTNLIICDCTVCMVVDQCVVNRALQRQNKQCKKTRDNRGADEESEGQEMTGGSAVENDEQMENEIQKKKFPHYSQFVNDVPVLLSPPNDLPTSITMIASKQLNEKCLCVVSGSSEDTKQLLVPFTIFFFFVDGINY